MGWQTDCLVYSSEVTLPDNCNIINSLQDANYDIIFHLSSYIPYHDFNSFDDDLYRINIDFTKDIISKYKKSKIIFSSSVSVYGTPQGILNEKSAYNNPNPYGLSKLCGEFLIMSCSNYSILRFSSLYGKGMNSETFLPKIIEQAKNNKKIIIYGDGSRKQDYLYIDDAVTYCLKATETKNNEIYLAVNGKSFSNLDIALNVKKYTNCSIEFSGIDNSSDFIYDNSFSVNTLQFSPEIDIEYGIKHLLLT